jgi:hypothetical protein
MWSSQIVTGHAMNEKAGEVAGQSFQSLDIGVNTELFEQ